MSVVQTLIVRVLLLGLSLGSAIVCARTLGPAGRGEQSAIGLWPYLVSGLATLGAAPSLNYHTSRGTRDAGGLLLAGSLLAIFAGTMAAVAGSLVVPHLLTKYSPDAVRAALFLLLFTPLLSLSYVLRANFEARGEFLRSNLSRLWPPLCTLVVLIALWAFHLVTPFSANLALFVPMTLQTAWLIQRLWSRLSFNFSTLTIDLRTLLSYGLRSWATDVMITLSAQVDQAMIIAFLSPTALGLYAVGLAASRTLNVLQNSLNTVLFPKASGLNFEDALELVGRLTRISNIISAIATAAFIAIVPILLVLFYGKAFAAAAGITSALCIETFLAGVASVLAQSFLATGRPTVVTVLQGGWVVTSLIFLALLVPRMGINGAAVALVVSSFVRLLATLVCYPIVLHRPIPRLLPISTDFQYLSGKLQRFRKA